jgi:Glyoxalase superfamily protein
MRDFRDAKAMAQTLRAALAAMGFKTTVSQSLELIAQAFGAADWNTLSAAIRAQATAVPENSSRPSTTAENAKTPGHHLLSAELISTLKITLSRPLDFNACCSARF